MASAEAVAAVIEAGGRARPGADGARSRSGSPRSPPSHGACSPSTPGATIAAGGKRLRPLLVFVAAGRTRRAAMRRCARRSRSSWCTRPRWSTTTCSTPPRCAAAGRRWSPPRAARSRPPPATCCSRARSPSWPAAAGRTRCGCSRTRPPRSPQGELLQREDAWNVAVDARALPAALRPQDRAAVPGRVRAGRAGGRRRRGRCWASFGRADRAGVPAARRRARRLRAGRAHRQAPRHRPARRHGHAAADPRARARPGARARSTCARSARRSRPRRVRRDRGHGRAGGRRARRRWRWSPTRRRSCRRCRSRPAGRRSSWWPTASSTATASLEVLGQDRVGGERGDEALDLVLHVRLRRGA